jgi:hypothetical protein
LATFSLEATSESAGKNRQKIVICGLQSMMKRKGWLLGYPSGLKHPIVRARSERLTGF